MSQSWKGKDDIVRGSLDLVIICLMIKLPVEIITNFSRQWNKLMC